MKALLEGGMMALRTTSSFSISVFYIRLCRVCL